MIGARVASGEEFWVGVLITVGAALLLGIGSTILGFRRSTAAVAGAMSVGAVMGIVVCWQSRAVGGLRITLALGALFAALGQPLGEWLRRTASSVGRHRIASAFRRAGQALRAVPPMCGLFGCYLAALILPQPGVVVNEVCRVCVPSPAGGVVLSAPAILLAVMLFGAGRHRRGWNDKAATSSSQLAAAVAVVTVVPPAVLLAVAAGTHAEPGLMTGFALCAAVPVAAATVSWCGPVGGHLPLTVALVLGSTALTPIATPLLLSVVLPIVTGTCPPSDGFELLPLLATHIGLLVWLPTVAGALSARRVREPGGGRDRVVTRSVMPRALLYAVLYLGACESLPVAWATTRFGPMAATAISMAAAICVGTAGLGWLAGRGLGLGPEAARSTMLAAAVRNNATALCLVPLFAGGDAFASLAVLAYSLTQHAIVSCLSGSGDRRTTASSHESVAGPGCHVVPRPAVRLGLRPERSTPPSGSGRSLPPPASPAATFRHALGSRNAT